MWLKLKGFLIRTRVPKPQNKFPHGRVIAPASSIAHQGDKGLRAHTHLQIFLPEQAVAPFVGPPAAGLGFETPASLACVYSLVPKATACNPNLVFANPTGGFGAIALVDAFHYPTALTDLQTFSAQFGLKAPNLTVVFASGVKPVQDPTGGWELEAALDLQWAHAMAPDARLFLVEAASDSFSDLLAAERVAGNLVAGAGGGEVSNSWGSNEFSGETSLDFEFHITAGVVYFRVLWRRSARRTVSGSLSGRGGRRWHDYGPQSFHGKLPVRASMGPSWQRSQRF